VVDFAPHEHEELRLRDAHARLGFADEAVCKWMAEAGLEAQVVNHLEGGDLTVTIWLGHRSVARLELVA
jgi:ArsR family transcriptional regulator